MNKYIENLKSFLSEQTPHYGYDDANSLLEMLCYYYMELNPVDNGLIRCQFKELDGVLSKLSFSDNNAVFSLAGTLCSTYEKQAFKAGVGVGLMLRDELDTLQET